MRTGHILLALGFLPVWVHAQDWQAEWWAAGGISALRPSASITVSPDAKIEVRGGVFVFDIPSAKSSAFLGIGTNPQVPDGEPAIMGDSGAWDARKPTTVEVRLRVVRAAPGVAVAAQVYVGDGRYGWLLNLTMSGVPGVPVDTTQFHTYRITLKSAIANLYVDGKLAPAGSLSRITYPRNGLLVGDISSGAGGVSEWQYVRWTNKEATPWQASEEEVRRMEALRVMLGDREGDVEEVNIAPPFGEVATLPDGRIMSWYPVARPVKYTPGEAEETSDAPDFVQKAFARFSEDNGITWGPPEELFTFPQEPGSRTDGMALVTRSGALHVFGLNFFKCALKVPFDYSQFRSDLYHARSPDGRSGWKVQKVDFGYAYTGASNSAIQLRSGRILVPISRYSDRPTGRFVTCVPYSDDDGLTWHRPVDEIIVDTGGAALESGACEPVATELSDGRVWMLLRAQDGYQWESYSTDGGLHWTPPVHSRFVSTNSPVATLRLHDGRIVVIWSNCGSDNSYNRLVLAAAITDDDGKTWRGYREVARGAEDAVFSYPYATEARDGKIVANMIQGARMIRLDPNMLTRMSLHEDFAEGLARWSRLRTEGTEAVADPDGGAGKVLRLRKPNAAVAAGACLNFPFGARGQVKMNVRLQPGSQGVHIALSDHYDTPDLKKEGAFAFRISGSGSLEVIGQGGVTTTARAGVQAKAWHEVTVSWDCPTHRAALSLDGTRLGELPQLSDAPGVCYLRILSLADKTDEAGCFVRSVSTVGSE